MATVAAMADYKSDIGWTQLSQELGAAMPTGAGIPISQVEAYDASNYYWPLVSWFPGKTITLENGGDPTKYSGHAQTVASYLYGTSGIAPGINTINVYQADSWRLNFVETATSQEPTVETSRIENHSWIGSGSGDASTIDALRRFDYMINRDGFFAAVGVDNVDTTGVPRLLAQSYNAMSVGVSSGISSHGHTNLDVSGRIKPDIVAEASNNLTSYATAVVSGSAALLLQTADANAGLVDARHHSEVIRSIFMSGARKQDFFSDWDRTPTRPLDDRYGSGLLNVYNSYHILTAGEQHNSNTNTVGLLGWDYAQSSDTANLYYIDVPIGSSATLSTSLNWNRTITDGNPGSGWSNPQAYVADMSLRLYKADSSFGLGQVVDESISDVDNVELIYNRTLTPGRYALEVTSDTPGNNYALSWQTTLGTLPFFPGDATRDGKVNFDDYLALEAGFGSSGSWSQGDFDGNGVVNFDDYLILEANFGTSGSLNAASSLMLSSPADLGSNVPEPGTLGLLLVGALALMRRHRA